MPVDEFSTIRATWDVWERTLVQCEGSEKQDRLLASFMDYQDCYVFMKGLAVASGWDFSKYLPDNSIRTANKLTEYYVKTREVYLGKRGKA